MLITIGARPDHGFDEPLGLLSDCHRRIERFLDTLVLTTAAAAGGPLVQQQRADIDAALTYFRTAAPKHTADEEESLFPRLRASHDAAAADALATMARLERDHDVADEHHRAADALLRQWLAADRLDAASLSALRGHLTALQAIYAAHIAIEDRELFPAAGRVLTAEALAAVGREMADRRRLR
ncbi:MAG TPA: hemerythrin domain-containing protein [Vicinamibacterales bacterium]|nr:hemerythrin domain-containing protein [Vicinamibacterales bacterium]